MFLYLFLISFNDHALFNWYELHQISAVTADGNNILLIKK